MSDSVRGYSSTARILHWVVAILVLSTVPAAFVMVQEGISRSLQDSLFIYHKNVGVLIFFLVVARLIFRVTHPAPALPGHVPEGQRRIAFATHWLLYALLLVMSVSGYVRVEAGNFPIEMLDALGIPPLVPVNETLEETAQSIHLATRYVLIPLVLLHVGAALYHLLVRRDGVFGRMWPPVRS